MISHGKICLVGDIVVDVTLKTPHVPTKMRLGGIVHAARALWSMNIPYDVAFIAPSYLDSEIVTFLNAHGCSQTYKVGDVTGAPYLFLIEEAKEIGDQGYEFILRDQIKINYNETILNQLISIHYSDILMISGNYDQHLMLERLKGCISVDVANNVLDLSYFSGLKNTIDTVFLSTSSNLFKNLFNNSFRDFCELFRPFCQTVILKENRGGSRGFSFGNNEIFTAAAQTQPILHSVGVGDVFDACSIARKNSDGWENALAFASWAAAEYAQTTYPDDFQKQVKRLLKANPADLVKMGGVQLPWEERNKVNIYIAAPDFDFVDRLPIEQLVKALEYHNFRPRRPIMENGQMEKNASKERRQTLFSGDMKLLEECQMMIAVLLYNDPGTLIEIGIGTTKGLPTFVYDVYNAADNCMLTEIPTLLSADLDSIISEVFIESSKIANGKS